MKKKMDNITTNYLSTTFPKVKPEKSVGNYAISKIEKRRQKIFPEWDVPSNSIKFALYENQQKLYQIEGSLKEVKTLSIERQKELDVQWKDLAEKHTAFRKTFQKFNKFVKENQEKRERYEKKIEEALISQVKYQEDIEDMRGRIQQITEVKATMEKNIRDYRMYESYLQSVVRTSDTFKNINDLIRRHESLAYTKYILSIRQGKELGELEQARSHLAKLVEGGKDKITGLNNKLTELWLKYKTAKTRSLALESLVNAVQEAIVKVTNEIHIAKTTCHALHKNSRLRRNVKSTLRTSDVEEQLSLIGKTLRDLHCGLRRAKK